MARRWIIGLFSSLLISISPILSAACDSGCEGETTPNGQLKTEQLFERGEQQLDWYPIDLLPSPSESSSLCGGAYYDPMHWGAIRDKKEQLKLPIIITANEAQGSLSSTNEMFGEVSIQQGNRLLRGDQLTWSTDQRQGQLTGGITLRQPNLHISGDQVEFDLNQDLLKITDAEYVIHNKGSRGHAGELIHSQQQQIVLKQGSFTQCRPGDNAWRIVGSELTLDPGTGYATAKHIRLEVKDTPIGYLPYLKFPYDGERHTGILFPVIGSTSTHGLDFAVPYYFNLAPNYDATYTPRWTGDRGILHEGEYRHLTERQRWQGGATYMEEDQLTGERPRWLINMSQRGGRDRPWDTHLEYTRVSDHDYFDDLSVTELGVSQASFARQHFSVGYQSQHWNYRATVEQYQRLDLDEVDKYRRLPELHANGLYLLPGNMILDWKNNVALFRYTNPELTFDDGSTFTFEQPDGHRLHIQPTLSMPMTALYGFFTPSVTLYHTEYEYEDLINNGDIQDSRSIVSASLDSSLIFERDINWFNKQMLQTLEPRLYYLYTDYEDQEAVPLFDTVDQNFSYYQLFRANRFSGYDRVADANQISLGLTSNLSDNQTGELKASASIGQIMYFRDRAVQDVIAQEEEDYTRNQSPIVAQVLAPINKRLTLINQWQWDPDGDTIDESRINLRYQYQDRLINFSYLYARLDDSLIIRSDSEITDELMDSDIDQVDVSAVWPLSRRWSAIGRWNYDFTFKRDLDVIAGFEYNSCCWRLQFVHRKWLSRDNVDPWFVDLYDENYDYGTFIQIELKGLAGIGSQIAELLDQGIWGYQQREAYLQ